MSVQIFSCVGDVKLRKRASCQLVKKSTQQVAYPMFHFSNAKGTFARQLGDSFCLYFFSHASFETRSNFRNILI